MSNELVRRNLELSVTSSLSDLVKATEVIMLLVDTSGSMAEYVDPIARGRFEQAWLTRVPGQPVDAQQFGGRAIDKLREAVQQIQSSADEAIPMIAFGGPFDAQVRFVDVVPEPDGGTPLHLAIPLAKEYGATRVVVVSDGCPDLREQSMEEARRFGGRVDVVYVGTEKGGLAFLKALAASTGGSLLQGDLADVKKITSAIIGLLDGEVAPAARVFATDADGGATETEAPEPVEADEDDEDEDEDEDEDDDDE